MKKILLMFFVVFSICACSQKESKPNIELEEGNSTPENVVANIANSIEGALNATNDKREAQPYYFSEGLKDAVLNCTPYEEELFAKNPDMVEESASTIKMFAGDVDTSSFKFDFIVKGKKDDKCQILMKHDLGLTITESNCEIPEEWQKKLFDIMNDTSTEKKKRTIEGIFSITLTAREFDLAIGEISNKFCKAEIPQDAHAKIEKRQKEIEHKMLAFSDKFKNSLKTCTPDTEVLEVMGMEMNKAKIKGKEKGKCHVVLQGFHILLNDDELSSISGFDELGELLSDETRATYSPSYKYQGTLFALSECEQISKSKDQNMRLGSGKEELSLSDKVKITRGIDSSVKDNACQVIFTLKITRNGKTEDHSLSCNLTAEQLAQHIKPYSNLLAQYGPKISIEEGSFSMRGGRQTEEVSKVDQELFLKMYKSGICKK